MLIDKAQASEQVAILPSAPIAEAIEALGRLKFPVFLCIFFSFVNANWIELACERTISEATPVRAIDLTIPIGNRAFFIQQRPVIQRK